MTAQMTRLNPPELPNTSSIGYSQISIAEAGKMAFVSGQVATAENGLPAPKDFDGQAAQVMRKAANALAAIGAKPEDIAIARIYVVGLNDERLASTVNHFKALCGDAAPSLTGIGVAALAGADLLIEMEMQVRLPE
jgi:enamine deaminase RidA (YjgF/YER057c/UK114 family)